MLAAHYLRIWYIREYVMVFAVEIMLYTFAAWCLLKPSTRGETRAVDPVNPRRLLFGILVVAVLLRLIALSAPQSLTTDVFRYVWDGRVQNAGINPYRYVPADPSLAALRDDEIFPNINRADYAHTIYPPAAQLIYRAVERVADGILPMKLAMLGFDLLGIGCLIVLLRRRKQPVTRVLLYAWHPLPVWEFSGSGHADAAAIGLMLLAFVLAEYRVPALAGVALAAATLVKFYPLLMAPAVYRRWGWKLPLLFVATIVLLYLPFLDVGRGVLGFLPAYASEEGFVAGHGIYLLSMIGAVTGTAVDALHLYLPVAGLILVAIGLRVLLRPKVPPVVDVSGAVLLAATFVFLSSPHFAWYFAWLVPFLCFRFHAGVFWLTAASTLIYVVRLPLDLYAQSLIYLPAVLLLIAQALLRPSSQAPETDHVDRTPESAAV